MINLTTHEVDDLKHCRRALERVLATLDTVGAGIAAIHINAAIEQLKKNISSVTVNADDVEQHLLLFPDENQ